MAAVMGSSVQANELPVLDIQTTARASEAPRVRAILELASAAESGIGQRRNPTLAALLYCDAATQGSAEAQYRLARLFVSGTGLQKDVAIAATLFGLASESGHERAGAMLALTGVRERRLPQCFTDPESVRDAYEVADNRVDIERYVDALPKERRVVAALIRRLAPRFGVERRLALAIAAVESNFDTRARSPKNAMGVMQLIPETAQRFKVRNAFDAEQNVRGGLAYLSWLLKRFGGDTTLVAAAYNAGEGAVERHSGVPPYAETQSYVRRIRQYLHLPKARDVRETLRSPE
jgi:TPR repeat protein